jgi:hypothetical protein
LKAIYFPLLPRIPRIFSERSNYNQPLIAIETPNVANRVELLVNPKISVLVLG